jgi:hypothetical protein
LCGWRGRCGFRTAAYSTAVCLPVRILSYQNRTWTQIAALPPPASDMHPTDTPQRLWLAPNTPIASADVTGDSRPDFLIFLSAADNIPGAVVSEAYGL